MTSFASNVECLHRESWTQVYGKFYNGSGTNSVKFTAPVFVAPESIEAVIVVYIGSFQIANLHPLRLEGTLPPLVWKKEYCKH